MFTRQQFAVFPDHIRCSLPLTSNRKKRRPEAKEEKITRNGITTRFTADAFVLFR
jgi:hypothetical protein